MELTIKRIIAFFINYYAASIVVVFPVALIMSGKGPGGARLRDYIWYVILAGFLLCIVLNINFLTPGKRLIGLTVANVGGDTRVPLWKQIVRSLTLLIWPIEALVVVLSSSHRRISDRILGLEVIEIKRKSKE